MTRKVKNVESVVEGIPEATMPVLSDISYVKLGDSIYTINKVCNTQDIDMSKAIREFYKQEYIKSTRDLRDSIVTDTLSTWNTQVNKLNEVRNSSIVSIKNQEYNKVLFYHSTLKRVLYVRHALLNPCLFSTGRSYAYLHPEIVLPEEGEATDKFIIRIKCELRSIMQLGFDLEGNKVYVLNERKSANPHTSQVDCHKLCIGTNTAKRLFELDQQDLDDFVSFTNMFSKYREYFLFNGNDFMIRDLLTQANLVSIEREVSTWITR